MAFPPQFLDEIRARVPVSDVVARKVKLARRGREFVGLSPFNKEKSPSFTVNDEKGFFHCFSSGEHGDVFTFLMKTEGLSFPEAVERLASLAGLEMPRSDPRSKEREERRAGLQEVVERAARWYQEQLAGHIGKAARAYLADRGLGAATIERFRIGFAPDGRGQLAQSLTSAGIGLDQITAAGLAKPAEGGGSTRDYFFNRIIFPITDRRGRVVAFGGRTMGDGQPKYLNSPESQLFHKGSMLYGFALARDAAREAGTVVVAEGYMDVIALAQVGINNAVAPLGTALTEDQMRQLWQLADEPVLCFDGDTAGSRAAGRAALRAMPLLKPGKSLRFALLPEGEDPDSLVNARGPEAFHRVVARAKPLVDVIWELEAGAGKFDTPERQAALKANLRKQIAEIADNEVSEFYKIAFDQRLDKIFPRRQGRGGFGRGGGGYVGGRRADWKRGSKVIGAQSRTGQGLKAAHGDFDGLAEGQERALLALLIHHPALVSAAAESIAAIRLTSTRLDRILREILNLLGSEPDLDSEDMKRHLDRAGYADLKESVLSDSVIAKASFAAAETAEDEAEQALHDILDWHRRRQDEMDRRDAERELAEDMTEAKEDRLFGILREQIKEDGMHSK
jgi:DNA primase